MNLINNIKSVFQTTNKIRWIGLSEIKIDSEIESIFVQKEGDIQKIAEDMKANGYDPAHPIILVQSNECPELNGINADGHTRYKAALRLGLNKVAVIYRYFSSREELIEYAYKQQLNRRNLSDDEIYKAYLALRSIKDEKGRPEKTDQEIADQLEISRRQVAKMKEVEKKSSPETLEAFKAGEITLNKAYTQMKSEESERTAESENLSEQESQPEEKLPASKAERKKKISKEYSKGFIDSWNYIFYSFKCGKTGKELKNEFAELESGEKSIEAFLSSLSILKENHEQKQVE